MNKPLKIIIIGVKWPPETFLQRLIDGLTLSGVGVTIAASSRPKKWLNGNFRRWVWAPSWNVNIPKRMMNSFRLLQYLPRWTAAELKSITLQKKSFREKLRSIYLHLPFGRPQWDLVYFPWVLGAERYLDWFVSKNIPIVVSLRGSMINIDPYIPGKSDQVRKTLQTVFQKVSSIHCVSQDILDEAVRFGLDPAKACIIRPAVDPLFFIPSENKTVNHRFTLITTGSLIWRKGYEYALMTIRSLVDQGVDAEYHIIGDGPERQRILYTIQDLDLERRVILHGKLQPEAVRDQLQKADVFLLSSLSEGISNAVLEAMSCGLPVVTTDCGGIREAVTNNVEGFVVPLRDPVVLARSVKILAENQDLRKKMGIAARQRVLKEFSLENQIEDWKNLLSNYSLDSSEL